MRHVRASVKLLFLGTFFFGLLYPFCIWVVAHLCFKDISEGEMATFHGRTVGLVSVGQSFSSQAYFWPRPSSLSKEYFPLIVSQGSNLSWSSPVLLSAVEARARALKGSADDLLYDVPHDMLMASASGIDPEISLKGALFQVPRVAAARGVSEDELRAIVLHMEEQSLWGLFPRRLNVLKLNCAIDHHYPLASSDAK
jgi:potassium-transporting ATPase KdpC subunit